MSTIYRNSINICYMSLLVLLTSLQFTEAWNSTSFLLVASWPIVVANTMCSVTISKWIFGALNWVHLVMTDLVVFVWCFYVLYLYNFKESWRALLLNQNTSFSSHKKRQEVWDELKKRVLLNLVSELFWDGSSPSQDEVCHREDSSMVKKLNVMNTSWQYEFTILV